MYEHVSDDTSVFAGFDEREIFFLCTPSRSLVALLVKFTQIIHIVNIITYSKRTVQ